MVNHGIIASALFLIVGIIEQKLGTRDLEKLRGLRDFMPVLYGIFMLIALAALGLPGLNGFVGEFLILMGVWTSGNLGGYAAIYVLTAGLAIVFASMYMLYFFQGAMQETNADLPPGLKDIGRGEVGMLIPACVLIVFIGWFPKTFTDRMAASVKSTLAVEKTVAVHDESAGEHH
jgi:NADH-quinone oxidoreductase subunit M